MWAAEAGPPAAGRRRRQGLYSFVDDVLMTYIIVHTGILSTADPLLRRREWPRLRPPGATAYDPHLSPGPRLDLVRRSYLSRPPGVRFARRGAGGIPL